MCGPSRAGFITGRYQSSFGYYQNAPQPLAPKQGLPNNIAAQHPELVEKLSQQWEDWDQISAKQQLFLPTKKAEYQFGSYDWLKGNVNYKAP